MATRKAPQSKGAFCVQPLGRWLEGHAGTIPINTRFDYGGSSWVSAEA